MSSVSIRVQWRTLLLLEIFTTFRWKQCWKLTHDILFRFEITALFIFQLECEGKLIEHTMYERLRLFRYVLNREFVARTRFVKSLYDAVDIIFRTHHMWPSQTKI